MSLKRKASEFDEAPLSPEPSLSSSQGSIGSNLAAEDNNAQVPYNLWNIAGAPYFNSRTRKRLRDGRPSEETIHERTLRKLFDAQKRGSPDQQSSQLPSPGPDTSNHLRFSSTARPISGPTARVELQTDRNQRGIQSFFNGNNNNCSDSSAMPVEAHGYQQPPLTPSLYQPDDRAPHLVRPHPTSMPSVLLCEDCDAPLLTKNTVEAIDAEMFDSDGPQLVNPEVGEGWTCVLCLKRVCDTCAVRGDYRVCLECAVPGGGKYRPEELHEKRWVGGIGWM